MNLVTLGTLSMIWIKAFMMKTCEFSSASNVYAFNGMSLKTGPKNDFHDYFASYRQSKFYAESAIKIYSWIFDNQYHFLDQSFILFLLLKAIS